MDTNFPTLFVFASISRLFGQLSSSFTSFVRSLSHLFSPSCSALSAVDLIYVLMKAVAITSCGLGPYTIQMTKLAAGVLKENITAVSCLWVSLDLKYLVCGLTID